MKNLYFFALISFLALGLSSNFSYSDKTDTLEKNKAVVRDFYEIAFNQHQPEAAMKKHGGAQYIQHNPFAKDGKQAFVDYFKEKFKNGSKSFIEIKRIIAEGDLVVLHIHSRDHAQDRGRAVMDIFRVQDGKIVEHWDVGQVIPEKLAHTNTMF